MFQNIASFLKIAKTGKVYLHQVNEQKDNKQ